jgi:predicted ATP-binding protein involved in virulence
LNRKKSDTLFSMRIDKLRLKNFRAYEDIEIEFHPNFNVIIGNNGIGKTAILEALTIAIGSYFLGMDYAENRHIQNDDIRITNSEYDINEQFPVEIEAWGEVEDEKMSWLRELTGPKNKTTYVKALLLKNKSKQIQDRVRAGEVVDLPVIVYYSTERLWKERLDTTPISGMRLKDGYYNGLRATSNNKFFTKWFEKEEIVVLQQRKDSVGLRVVRSAVVSGVEGCQNIYYDYNRRELILEFKDGRKLPFQYLSDGVRNMLAMVADIAFRCVLLNPHLKEDAARLSKGVVLIDELDLHLHPGWQKRVVQSLKDTFPLIQFITTTHSPLILSTAQDRVITIEDGKTYNTINTFGRTANDILKNAMQTSERPDFVQNLLDDYFELIDGGEGQTTEATRIRQELETLIGKDDPELARADILINFMGI